MGKGLPFDTCRWTPHVYLSNDILICRIL